MKTLLIALALVAVGCKQKDKTQEAAPGGSAEVHAHGGSAQPGSAQAGSAQPAPAADAGPPPNVVQTEMRMLTEILEHTVRGIGTGDVRPIEVELHRLHEAKEATTAAVKSGAYKLPKNADQVAQFEAMDEAFHEHLGALVKASRANDVPAAADALGAIVKGCAGCHATFRP